jgi:hypothetical protein
MPANRTFSRHGKDDAIDSARTWRNRLFKHLVGSKAALPSADTAPRLITPCARGARRGLTRLGGECPPVCGTSLAPHKDRSLYGLRTRGIAALAGSQDAGSLLNTTRHFYHE